MSDVDRGCERAYPPDLARWVAAHWPAATPLAISEGHLHDAIAAAYQASMTTEEMRPTRFRLLLTRPDALPPEGEPNHGVLRLKFDRTRPLHSDELRRLAPSVPFETALIGVHAEADGLRIWGIAHSGPAWLAPTWGGRDGGSNWTFDPIIHVNGPGQVAVRRAGVLIGAIVRGGLVDTTLDVFDSAWLPALFSREREELRERHGALQAQKPVPTAVSHSLVGRISQHMLRRCIQLVRGAQHGGLILVHDGNVDGLRIKYGLERDEPTQRYRALLLRLLEALADSTPNASIDWADFVTSANTDLERLEQAVFEWSRVIANLAAIDGAVVLDKRFALVGFGAEVSADLGSPSQVWRALDREGAARRAEDIEAVGTRHRAAYRFVNGHPGSLAIVVSHDGGVTFVAHRDGEVVLWEQTGGP